MHELSIAEALIDQVRESLEQSGERGRVLRVELSVGRLSGVYAESLRFAFGMLAPDTVVEGAELVIHEPKAVCRCRVCHALVEIDDLVTECPRCAAGDIVIEGGRDMILQSIEIEDKDP
jgi:hydrogenase nickel incorporation protein HypA/HybF